MYKSNSNIAILYVEDEKDIRDSLSRFLKLFSAKLYTACDGAEGLKLYKQYNPDIVISDIKMPNMNGIDMTKAIKEIDNRQHIIFTTAHSENTYFLEAINLQVDGYVLKPIDLDKLENKINFIKEAIKLKQDYNAQQTIMNEIAKLQDNMLVVLDSKFKAIFSNDKFLYFLSLERLDEFIVKYKNLSDIFLKNDDFFYLNDKDDTSWIDKLQNLDDDKRVVSMMDQNTFIIKTFLVSIKFMKETSHTIIIFTEITNIAIQKKRFEYKAYTDELTNIHNRAFFNEELTKEIARYKRDKIPFSCILFDIDLFKNFNDTYGHQVGDDILIELSSIIQLKTRSTDIFARWGGEEFVKILPNTSLKNAKIVAEYLRTTIANHTFKGNYKVTCSFGVSEICENDTNESLLKKVDDALYKAKQNGRNRVEVKI